MWEFRKGDVVLWPNGVEGVVQGVEQTDTALLLLDECGGWIDAYDCDPIRRADGSVE
jgi:hypothetical protein